MIIKTILMFLHLLTPHYPTIPIATISQEFGHLGHAGIDFKVDAGFEVYADLDGVIIEEHIGGCYGRHLMLQHPDGYVSLYAHLSKYKVKVGETVSSGDLIALTGGDPNDDDEIDGCSSAAHLHWEVRPKGHTDTNVYNIDPMGYLNSFLKNKYREARVNSVTGLNVRLTPEFIAPVLYVLYASEYVQIVEEKNGWGRLNSIREEWVLMKWLNLK